MLSTAVSSVPWHEAVSIVGVIVLIPLVIFYLFPLDVWYHTFASWKKAFDDEKPNDINEYIHNSQELFKQGLSKANVFRIFSDNGIKTILAPKFANEIAKSPILNFTKIIETEFHANVKGFSPFGELAKREDIFVDAVRIKLTQALGSITKPLSEETSISLRNRWTDNEEWHDLSLKQSILEIVAQLSSRVFLGEKICRNPDWLRITVDYTVNAFQAGNKLRLWPELTRPVVAYFLSSTRKVQHQLREAERIIKPVLDERKRDKEIALKEGKELPRYNDAIDWLEQVSKGRPYDPAALQLTFSWVAIHTTSDMVTQAIYDLCERQELVEELRKEAISVVSSEGWKKSAMYKLQLMDSFLKESQRMKPISNVSMRRIVGKDFELSDGTNIPKGVQLMVSADWHWNSDFYENPLVFDPYRFLKMKQIPGRESHAHLVSPSPEHMGFGYGNHACPGRFFAVNEIKILLCHLLLKYDLKPAEGSVPTVLRYGVAMNSDPQAKISIRRRHEEIVLEEIS
ncbi:hypothetical protein N7476_002350 [Penicillium atrosanguineum]|uniref:Cytochrome P450 n=1 Tax=Penicillium atrosanguineum TaxID=1132637 RepID=A0A9W9U7J7_9EURO|nr:hypothetical protein N7526_005809 [Penicillium atrosanguineum]KAJ5323750.1 hypothetical protein N7476_002350 [Penicillium atrosanguineum]